MRMKVMVKQQNRRTVHIQMKYLSQSIGNCIVSWTVVCDAYRIQFCSEGEGSTKLHSDAHNFEENWNLVEWVSPCLWSGSPRCWRPRPSRQPRLGHRLRQPGQQDLSWCVNNVVIVVDMMVNIVIDVSIVKVVYTVKMVNAAKKSKCLTWSVVLLVNCL